MDERNANIAVVDDPRFEDLSDAVSHRRRRYALECLREHRILALPDVADAVAARERGKPLSDISPEEVLEVYTSLYDTHVPKLVDAGVAVYDQETDSVALAEGGERLAKRVDRLLDRGGFR